MERPGIDLGQLSLPELTDLQHLVTDEIRLRMMQQAGDNQCVCCGRSIPEGRQVCPECEEEGNEW